MSKRSVCTMCGNEVDGEKGFCGICGGKMNVVDVQDDFGGPAQSFGNIPPVTPVNPVSPSGPLPDNSPFIAPGPNMPSNQNNMGNDANRTAAIAGMVIGIVSVVLCCVPYLSIALGITGLILSVKGMKSTTARGMAIAGLVCSIVGLALGVIYSIYWSVVGCVACDSYNRYRRYF